MIKELNRRRVLRGVLEGGVVTVALPMLNCFLNGNGTAMAATGQPLPVRFGTWFWGLGMNPAAFTPKIIGANYDLPPELAPLKDVKQHINVFSGFNIRKDDAPNLCHYTGAVALRSGGAPATRNDLPTESIDVTVARKIGGFTRFTQLDATATGVATNTFSFNGPNSFNTPATTSLELYQRIFGPEFQDPNAPTFTPSPTAMLNKSALSGVMDDVKSLQRSVGAEDRARLDQYFTGLRQVENQLAHQLTKPEPIAACTMPKQPTSEPVGLDYELVAKRHDTMAELLIMALVCDQTRVFNLTYSDSFAATTRSGFTRTHHVATHEQAVDDKLGYQEEPHWFTLEAMKHWAKLVQALAMHKEGAGTVLDNTLVYAHSDVSWAKIHALEGIPMFTAGSAGGKLKTGLHIQGKEDPGTRLGYTALKVMGADVPSWGLKSNTTSKEIGEILA